MFYLAVGDYDLGIRQRNLGILIRQITGIQKNRTILFAHCHGKLIHDTAITAIEIVLRILSDQCQICHRQPIKSIQITQDHAGQHFQRCGRGKTGTIGNIAPDCHIKSLIQGISFIGKGPDNTQRIICPTILFAVVQIRQRHFHNGIFVEVR